MKRCNRSELIPGNNEITGPNVEPTRAEGEIRADPHLDLRRHVLGGYGEGIGLRIEGPRGVGNERVGTEWERSLLRPRHWAIEPIGGDDQIMLHPSPRRHEEMELIDRLDLRDLEEQRSSAAEHLHGGDRQVIVATEPFVLRGILIRSVATAVAVVPALREMAGRIGRDA